MAEQVEQKEQSSFRLIYYTFAGRGGPIRLAAAVGGIAFEDQFITMEEQKQQKADGQRRWSGPPDMVIMDKDGKDLITIGQSSSCLRYVGGLSGTYPSGEVERALVDEVLDSCEDMLNMVVPVWLIQDKEAQKKAVEALMKDKLTYWLVKFEARLEENEKRGNKNGFFVGDSITIADLKFLDSLGITAAIGILDVIKSDFKRINAVCDAVEKNEKVAAFLKQFKANTEDMKTSKKTLYKYAGKFVPGTL